MFTLTFWKATLERVLVTAAEALLALLTADGFGILELGAGATWSVVGLAALAALLKCVITGASTNGSPSVVNAEVLSIPAGTGTHRA
ncbi:holin [Arthrobacter sp. MDT1-65]